MRERQITVLGLGLMGMALAEALVADGYRVTGWNRHPERGDAIRGRAYIAGSALEAVSASPVVVVCVANYFASDEFLLDDAVTNALAGKTLIQMSSGTSAEALAASQWADRHGIDYLDAYPCTVHDQIATPSAAIFASGPRATFDAMEEILAVFGHVTYLGDDIVATNSTLTGSAPLYHGVMLGTIQGAAICKAEGIPISAFREVLLGFMPAVSSMMASVLDRIESGEYGDARAPISNNVLSTQLATRACATNGLPDRFAWQLNEYFREAQDAGRGDQDAAALIEWFSGVSPR